MEEDVDAPIQDATRVLEIAISVLHMAGGKDVKLKAAKKLLLAEVRSVLVMEEEDDALIRDAQKAHKVQLSSVSNMEEEDFAKKMVAEK
mmetsp:Transcript_10241/g.15372  ORF Transcript_10241/g.15372 Transcript_10241/m.15372 type:complete len:89 (-) Transcript_10241:403-669(-)|eukprot:CAMPEP_0171451646 /NCGR_PEP_ID=MMETSP0945-20130129/70_1 /TAXON_ID=109269 /ORGANISM="Vaucheria litorea, Strain CCMP2940" /LENGTH=88 /DNA_ID=CAMNT_0011976153 /DNA_START=1437 /DNA_END=1703 /DNA_ORIENTATION=-